MNAYDLLRFLHVLTVVVMAAPLYNLIVVNERLRFGKAHLQRTRGAAVVTCHTPEQALTAITQEVP